MIYLINIFFLFSFVSFSALADNKDLLNATHTASQVNEIVDKETSNLEADANCATSESVSEYEVSCDKVSSIIENLNQAIPDQNKKIHMDCVSEKSSGWWLFKGDFKSQIALSSPHGLCNSNEGSELNQTILSEDVHLGVSDGFVKDFTQILLDHGIKPRILPVGANIGAMYVLKALHYPICQKQ